MDDPSVTHLLKQLESGDEEALGRIVPMVYDNLRKLASVHLRKEHGKHTLQTTALVHEAYVRLAQQSKLSAENRNHFFSIASITMRRVLVDHARARKAAKRGGGIVPEPLDELEEFLTKEKAEEILAIDDALDRYALVNERGCQVILHRFFGGLTLEETAELLDVSVKTVQRDWTFGSAWLRKEVGHQLGLNES